MVVFIRHDSAEVWGLGMDIGTVPITARTVVLVKSSQVITLPIAKSQARSKQNKDMRKCSSVYRERGVLLPVLTSGGE
jgi:hypothetical protein